MANRAVFLDRDGTMAKDGPYCSCPDDFELFPETAEAVAVLNEHGFKVIVITNQSGVGRGYFNEATLAEIHEKMKREVARAGAWIDGIYYCPHHPDDACDCRKPKPKLILQAAREHDIDLKRSFMVGDLPMDIELGKNVGCKTALVTQQPGGRQTGVTELGADYIADNIYEIAQWILSQI